jgi:transposase
MKLQNQLKTQERFANHEYYGGLSTRLNASHVAQFVCKMRASLWAAERVYKGMEAKVGGTLATDALTTMHTNTLQRVDM